MSAAIGRRGDAIVAELSGDWTLGSDTPRFAPLADAALRSDAGRTGAVRTLTFDSSALGTWDSSLLIFLRQGQEYCDAHALALETEGLPAPITSLIALARAVPERAADSEAPELPFVERFGLSAISVWDDAHDAVAFTGKVAHSVGRMLLGRVRMRWREFWVVVQSNSSGALPIVTLIALLIGVIIAFLGVVVLRRFGAGYYASYLVGYGVLREMGALMTGIIMAGRTGAGLAAELGSMKISEEIDAYSTLGISPVDHLVVPRVLGVFVMMPLLVVYADIVGIIGGMGVTIAMLDLTNTQFITGLLEAVTLPDALLGVVKATIFGGIIGLAGCMKGLQAGSDSGAVGRAATSAVVLGITLIVFANAVVDWLAALLHV